MKRLAVILILAFFTAGTAVSQEMNKTVTDPKTGKSVLSGYCDKKGLQQSGFGEVYDQYYDTYDPDRDVIRQIRPLKKDVNVRIVLGTWCQDSKEQVPRFFKILRKLRWGKKNIEIICVNTMKEAEGIDLKRYDIQRVPTFIFMKDGAELGRIIETPVKSLEEDMLMILGG